MRSSSMRQIGVTGPGGPEVLRIEQAPVPTPGPGEVLVRVAAAGVNRPDIQQRLGLYPPPPGASPIIGLEIAGEVVELGAGVTSPPVGERVCALVNGGGYAEYCIAPAGQCLPWPTGYSAAQAGALAETAFTVWHNLFERGGLAAGETVLIHGGTGGIGTTAIQLAKLFGARVFATAGSAEKCAACVKLGAEAAFNYREQDFVEGVREIVGRYGVNVVLDIIGGPYVTKNLSLLAAEGRLVVISVQGGTKVGDFDILPVMMRRLTITGSTLRPRSPADKAAIGAALKEKIWPLLEAGKWAPVMCRSFPLQDAEAAHALMETSAHIGKIVLLTGPL